MTRTYDGTFSEESSKAYEARIQDHKRALHREQEHTAYLESQIAAPDMVAHPPHYTTGKIEVIDFILDQDFGYLAGQCVKYLARYRHKENPLEDLKKCQWYLSRLISDVEDGR